MARTRVEDSSVDGIHNHLQSLYRTHCVHVQCEDNYGMHGLVIRGLMSTVTNDTMIYEDDFEIGAEKRKGGRESVCESVSESKRSNTNQKRHYVQKRRAETRARIHTLEVGFRPRCKRHREVGHAVSKRWKFHVGPKRKKKKKVCTSSLSRSSSRSNGKEERTGAKRGNSIFEGKR
jgi:hypothetical protein